SRDRPLTDARSPLSVSRRGHKTRPWTASGPACFYRRPAATPTLEASPAAAGPSPLSLPLPEARRTPPAAPPLAPQPPDDALGLRPRELATKAPSGSNQQNWEFVVVRDRAVKQRLGRLNRRAFALYSRIARRMAAGDAKMQRLIDAVQWQADHFDEIPVV